MSRALQRELDDLRAEFDRRVVDRVRLILQADKVADNVVYDAASSDTEIMAKAVSAAMGPAAIDGKSPDYIAARFDHLAEQKPIDPVRMALACRVDRRH